MKNKVYAQLYSLLKTNQEDLLPSLEALSKIGYDGVELMGTFSAGMSVAEYKRFLSDLKLDPISSHALSTEADFAWAQEMGIRYTDIRPDVHDTTRDSVLKECERMNLEGKLRSKYGIKAVIHNHSQEFRWVQGEENQNLIYDLLIANTDPEYVNFEFDVGWGAFSGVDPISIIEKYPGRFPLIHVKEALRVAKNDGELEHFPKEVLAMGQPIRPRHPEAGTTGIERGISLFSAKQARIMYELRSWNGQLGNGIIDWPKLVEACEKQGTVAYINEREHYGYREGNEDPVVAAKDDYDYLRSL